MKETYGVVPFHFTKDKNKELNFGSLKKFPYLCTVMKYSEFCEIQQGTVIIDDNGFGYVMGDELLYPSDPNEPFSIIRFHKFDCDGFRIATEAETRKFFKDLESNGFSWDKENSTVKPIPKPFDKLLKEAAKEYAGKLEKPRLTKGKRVSRMYPSNINAFIAGAKWMSEQGETKEFMG